MTRTTTETLGQRVARLRAAAGMDVEALAGLVGVHHGLLRAVEEDKPVRLMASELADLAEALELPMGDLWHGTGKGAPDYLPHPPHSWLKRMGLTSASIEFGQVAWKLYQETGTFSNHQVMEVLRAQTREEDEARRAERAAWLARHDNPQGAEET